MAVAPAQMADKIIILDLEEDESPQLSGLAPRSSSQPCRNKPVSRLQARQPVTIHATPSPFASSKKQTDALQAENQKLFKEVSCQQRQGHQDSNRRYTHTRPKNILIFLGSS